MEVAAGSLRIMVSISRRLQSYSRLRRVSCVKR